MRNYFIKVFFGLLYTAPVLLLALTACGGGGGTSSASNSISFNLGGSTVNLTNDGLVLKKTSFAFGDETIQVSAVSGGIATFNFSSVASGVTYFISVDTQPSIPKEQKCSVTRSAFSLSMDNDVTDVEVDCKNLYTISGEVVDTTGDGFQIQLISNLSDILPIIAGSGVAGDSYPYTFSGKIAEQDHFVVTAQTISSVTCSAAVSGVPDISIGSLPVEIASASMVADTVLPVISCPPPPP